MLAMKYMLLTGAIGLFIAAVAVLAYDLYAEYKFRREEASGITGLSEPEPVRWRTTMALVALAWAPMLIGLAIVVVPSGMAGVRVSQLSGTQAGTLYPGVHLVKPMLDHVEMFDTRDHLYTTGVATDSKIADGKIEKKSSPLNVQAKKA